MQIPVDTISLRNKKYIEQFFRKTYAFTGAKIKEWYTLTFLQFLICQFPILYFSSNTFLHYLSHPFLFSQSFNVPYINNANALVLLISRVHHCNLGYDSFHGQCIRIKSNSSVPSK